MAECFWTELAKVEQVCGDPGPEPVLWTGSVENGPGAIYSPPNARYAPADPLAEQFPSWVFAYNDRYGAPAMGANGRIYIDAENFNPEIGWNLGSYSGDFSEVEVDRIDRVTKAVLETTSFPGSNAITVIGSSRIYCDVAGLPSLEIDPAFGYLLRARLQMTDTEGGPAVDELFVMQYMAVPVVDDEFGESLWPGWRAHPDQFGPCIAYQYERFGCEEMETVTIFVDGVSTLCDVYKFCH